MFPHASCSKAWMIPPPTIDEHTLKIVQEAFWVKLRHIRKRKLDKPTILRLHKRVIRDIIEDYKVPIEEIKKQTPEEAQKTALDELEDDLNKGLGGGWR